MDENSARTSVRTGTLDLVDEGRHDCPNGAAPECWADTYFVSVVAPEVGILGVNHVHLSAVGVARFQANYLIDGVAHYYGNKCTPAIDDDTIGYSDDTVSISVTKPFEQMALTVNDDRFHLELALHRRFPHAPFDYEDCIGGNPLLSFGGVARFHGGHYDQPMKAIGTIHILDGPQAGQSREIDALAIRDHSWTDRFSTPSPWTGVRGPERFMHIWPSIQLPSRHLQGWGLLEQEAMGLAAQPLIIGGFQSTEDSQTPLRGFEAMAHLQNADRRAPSGFSFVITTYEHELLHVRTTRLLGTLRLGAFSLQNDFECRVDAYEVFAEFEVEETGEVGYGLVEYSITPPIHRWMV